MKREEGKNKRAMRRLGAPRRIDGQTIFPTEAPRRYRRRLCGAEIRREQTARGAEGKKRTRRTKSSAPPIILASGRALGLLLTLIIMASPALAANDPGHDSLYVLLTGDSNVSGSINLTSNLTANNIRWVSLLYGNQLDIRANTSIFSVSSRPAIQADANDLYLDSNGNLYLSTRGGTTGIVQVGPITSNGITLNVSGAIRQQNIRVCLENGTNCPDSLGSANITGAGAANYVAKWTSGSNLANSVIYDDGTNVGIGTTNAYAKLQVAGAINTTGNIYENNVRVCTASNGLCGSGNVTSSTTSTDNAIARYDGTTGLVIQNSAVTIDDGGNVAGVGNITTPVAFWIGSNGATANGTTSLAIGYNADAFFTDTIAIGRDTLSTSNGGISMGRGSTAGGTFYSIALGRSATASSLEAVGIGYNTYAMGTRTVVLGSSASSGTSASAIAIGYQSNSSGTGTIAIGDTAVVTSGTFYSIAIGRQSNSSGTQSIAIGPSSRAAATDSIAIGLGANASSGNRALAYGWNAYATGTDGIAIGTLSSTTGTESIAIGDEAATAHTNSVAIGRNATTTANNQLMIGNINYNLNTQVFGILNTTGNLYENNARVCTESNGLCAGMSSFTIAGDDDSSTVSNGETVTIAGSGTIDTAQNARTITISVQADSIDGAQLADSISLDANLAVNGGGNVTFNSSVLHVDNANNRVGIGTNTPSMVLDVSGGINSIGSGYFMNSLQAIATNGGTNITVGESSSFTGILLKTDGTTRVEINSAGNVGIGAQRAQSKLHVDTGNVSINSTYSMCFNSDCTARIYHNGSALIIEGQ